MDMENLGQNYSLHLPKEEEAYQDISLLLDQHAKLYAEPLALPPQRGSFNHIIQLQPGAKPFNIRPYRYSYLKNNIIERLVKDMLQQGVI